MKWDSPTSFFVADDLHTHTENSMLQDAPIRNSPPSSFRKDAHGQSQAKQNIPARPPLNSVPPVRAAALSMALLQAQFMEGNCVIESFVVKYCLV